MVLIYSYSNDTATTEVGKWLSYYNQDYVVITSPADFESYGIKINPSNLSKKIKSIWYRKLLLKAPSIETDHLLFNKTTTRFLLSETRYFFYALESLTNGIKSLGSGFSNMELNKIHVLNVAKSLKIKIPDFIITGLKTDLEKFKNRHKQVITKPIFDAQVIAINEVTQGLMYTKIITDQLLTELPEIFFPSLVQIYIEKDFEVRTFFMNGQLFSSAIITTNDGINIDYRNREAIVSKWLPYQLPISLERKICTLMNALNLNIGTIDLIKRVNGDFYFLEVNPSGHFDSISNYCNYNLHKEIAEWLINQRKN